MVMSNDLICPPTVFAKNSETWQATSPDCSRGNNLHVLKLYKMPCLVYNLINPNRIPNFEAKLKHPNRSKKNQKQ
jgi:hypothetical protein